MSLVTVREVEIDGQTRVEYIFKGIESRVVDIYVSANSEVSKELSGQDTIQIVTDGDSVALSFYDCPISELGTIEKIEVEFEDGSEEVYLEKDIMQLRLDPRQFGLNTRDKIYEMVDKERNYQDDKWEEHPHSIDEWKQIMNSQDNTIAGVLKAIAVGVACLEQHGIPDEWRN